MTALAIQHGGKISCPNSYSLGVKGDVGKRIDVVNPAVHFGMMGDGERAWYGWPDVPLLEKLVTDWVRATDQTKRKLLADEIQKVALSRMVSADRVPKKTSVTYSSLTRRFSGT